MFMEATIEHPNGIAPTVSPGQNKAGTFRLGAKGGKGAQAWQYVWDHLSTTEWISGTDLAQEAADKFGLKLTSMVELLSRMRTVGALDQNMLPIVTTYRRDGGEYTARRPRVHYRIAREMHATLPSGHR